MRAAFSLRMAWRHVRAGRGRLVLSVLAVALGVALVVAIRLANAAVLDAFLDTVDAMAGRATFSVTAGEGLTFPETVVERVGAVPQVALAVPLVAGVAFPDDGSGEALTVHGVDLTHDAAVRLYHVTDEAEDVVDDLVVFLARPDSIVLGREFARRRGLARGSALDLVTPTGVRRFTVRGLLEPQGLARTLGGRLVVMDLYAAERAFAADGRINRIDVVVAEGADIEAARRAVEEVLPPGLGVEEPRLRKDVVRRTVGAFQAMLTAFGLLAAVAGFVVCYSRLRAVFAARRWEAGLWRAVGLRRATVFVELLKEGLVLGVGGAGVGIPLGALLAPHVLPHLATATAINFRLPLPSAATALDSGTVVLGAAVGVGAAVLAAAVPALGLSRVPPAAALRLRGREAAPGVSRAPRGVRLGLLGAIVALVLWQRAGRTAAIGHLTTALVALTAWAFASPLIVRGGEVVTALWGRLFGVPGRFAGRQLGRQARGLSPVVAALGVGVGTVLMFGILGWSFERTLVERISRHFRADLIVSSAFVSGGYRNAPLSEALIDELRQVPGVALVTGTQAKDVPYRDEQASIEACDPPCFTDARITAWRLDAGALPETLSRVQRGEAVLVTREFAARHGARPGGVVALNSPNGVRQFQVAAVTGTVMENTVIMVRDVYRALWNDPTVFLVHLVLEEGARPAVVEAALLARLGARHRLQVRSSAALVEYFASQARQAFGSLGVMEAMALLLVLVGIGDTLAASVVERTRELGTMRAIGLRRAGVFRVVALEGAAIGVLGLVAAAGVGLSLGTFWVEMQFPMILGWILDLHCPVGFALRAAGLTVVICLAGSLLPALRAARLRVQEALRAE